MRKTVKIINVVGARPNFMKIAPLMNEMAGHPDISPMLIHTGQHYDDKMSRSFFDDLNIPKPDINLEVGSGTHAEQTAEIMKRFEPVLLKEKPDGILVVGDVNSTIACALTASKLGIKVIHVEAGLRSYDRTMPEEINRVLTDALSDLLFTSERKAGENLLREGIHKEKIFFVGNVMIDTLLEHRKKAGKSDVLRRLKLNNRKPKSRSAAPAPYALLTLHRPSNVDCVDTLGNIMEAVSVLAGWMPVIFPIHPRTKRKMEDFGFMAVYEPRGKKSDNGRRIVFTEPLGYLDFLRLMADASIVLTDSGGIQEETTVLGIPCVTLRENTERPVTITEGTNRMVGTDRQRIIDECQNILNGGSRPGRVPELWDGKASQRIVNVIVQEYS
jgi:UDP-N-acetylglucosamine 2-epimerase (non-hydrolysing)